MKSIGIFVKNLSSGGAEKQSVLLALSLSDKYNVYYIVFNGEQCETKYLSLLETNNRINIIRCYGNPLSKLLAIKKEANKHNISVLFSYLTAANFYSALIGGLSKSVKRVYTGIRNAELPAWKERVDKLLSNNLSAGSIHNSFSGLKHFQSRGFKSSKTFVIPNCIENISPYKAKQAKENRVDIITVGRFVPQKDYKTALQTIQKVISKEKTIDVFLSIVGYGVLEDDIKAWINEYGLENNVNIYINPSNIPELLNNSDIYLSTSLFEGTSNSIMEAMNADLPVVATGVGDNNQLVEDNVNGFLHEVGNVSSLSKSILKLIRSKNLRDEMGVASKKILQDKYSQEVFIKSYINLIEDIR